MCNFAALFFMFEYMHIKSLNKEYNGILLTLKSSEAVNGRRGSSGWSSWIDGRGVQSLTWCCCGYAEGGMLRLLKEI